MKAIESFVVGVVGTGAMGRGIAQLFAQSGHAVRLHDAAPGAADAAKASVADVLSVWAMRPKTLPRVFTPVPPFE